MKKLLKMASYAVLPLAALMMFSSYSGGPTLPQECPGIDLLGVTVLIPNPWDCTSYYACSNGVPILMYCPMDLVFNPELGTCDVPTGDECGEDHEDIDNPDDDDFRYKIIHQPCTITVSAKMKANAKLLAILGVKLSNASVGATINISDLTRLYTLAAEGEPGIRLGDDYFCDMVVNKLLSYL